MRTIELNCYAKYSLVIENGKHTIYQETVKGNTVHSRWKLLTEARHVLRTLNRYVKKGTKYEYNT